MSAAPHLPAAVVNIPPTAGSPTGGGGVEASAPAKPEPRWRQPLIDHHVAAPRFIRGAEGSYTRLMDTLAGFGLNCPTSTARAHPPPRGINETRTYEWRGACRSWAPTLQRRPPASGRDADAGRGSRGSSTFGGRRRRAQPSRRPCGAWPAWPAPSATSNTPGHPLLVRRLGMPGAKPDSRGEIGADATWVVLLAARSSEPRAQVDLRRCGSRPSGGVPYLMRERVAPAVANAPTQPLASRPPRPA